MILIKGGVGFIGSNFINSQLKMEKSSVINLDCLTHVVQPSNVDESFG